MANGFCSSDSTPSYPKWTTWDAIRWKLIPGKLGGGREHLFRYKDGWVAYNRSRIQTAANSNRIPVELLAGVAWIEVGGMPDVVDSIAHPIRYFDWSGPDWVDNHMTVTTHPHKTSVGSVSIQLSVAAKTMGINLESLDYENQWKLIKCMETDAFNLDVVASHLYQLIKYDFPSADSENLTDEESAIVASRYNRGTERKLSDFIDSLNAPQGSATREYTEYGRAYLAHRERIRMVLSQGGV